MHKYSSLLHHKQYLDYYIISKLTKLKLTRLCKANLKKNYFGSEDYMSQTNNVSDLLLLWYSIHSLLKYACLTFLNMVSQLRNG